MLREARIILILGQLIAAWKTHLTGGVASLSSGPGLYSDLRILQECREMADEDQTIEDILEPRNADSALRPGRITLSIEPDNSGQAFESIE
jgi:hypothetical protein